jgi:hypothetical protein
MEGGLATNVLHTCRTSDTGANEGIRFYIAKKWEPENEIHIRSLQNHFVIQTQFFRPTLTSSRNLTSPFQCYGSFAERPHSLGA